MVQKRTDRVQIQDFANRGIEIFDRVEQTLQALVDSAASVNYQGPNARVFKTACVSHAVDFAGATTRTMTTMNEVVQDNTSFIATALGGQRITLDPPNVTIQSPAINIDESVEQADHRRLTNFAKTSTTSSTRSSHSSKKTWPTSIIWGSMGGGDPSMTTLRPL